ncbi:hypothetical protein BAMA111019_16085 [Bacillus manliponensis]
MKKETHFSSSMQVHKHRISAITHFPKHYIIFIFSLLLSRIGDALYTFALPWIAYELTGSAIVMSSLFAAGVLPVVLFGPIVGIIVDRFDRRKLMWIADLGCMIFVTLIPILHMLNLLHIWHLYIVSFILAVLSTI